MALSMTSVISLCFRFSVAFQPNNHNVLNFHHPSFANHRQESIILKSTASKRKVLVSSTLRGILPAAAAKRSVSLFHSDCDDNGHITTNCGQRRRINQEIVSSSRNEINRRTILGMSAIASLVIHSPEAAFAKDSLFSPNPLTNPLLEQIRIWEQAEADELKYGGELTPGNAGNRGKTDAYPRLLLPILQMNDELKQVHELILSSQQEKDSSCNKQKALEILSQSKYDKIEFKKIFNAFGDNIYYSDPDRANLYLGGGATPRTEQSLAYLNRNEILTNVEALQAELKFLLNNNMDDEEEDDLVMFSENVVAAMDNYLALVSPKELSAAKELLSTTSVR